MYKQTSNIIKTSHMRFFLLFFQIYYCCLNTLRVRVSIFICSAAGAFFIDPMLYKKLLTNNTHVGNGAHNLRKCN